VGHDGHIAGGVSDAGEDESVGNLAILEERLVRLVDGSSNDLTSTGGASASAARVRKVKSLLLSLVENVGVIRALNHGLTLRGLEGDLVSGGGGHGGVDGGNRDAGERVASRDTEALVAGGAENASANSGATGDSQTPAEGSIYTNMTYSM